MELVNRSFSFIVTVLIVLKNFVFIEVGLRRLGAIDNAPICSISLSDEASLDVSLESLKVANFLDEIEVVLVLTVVVFIV